MNTGNNKDEKKLMMKIEGLIAAPLTGFYPDGSVNLEVIPDYAAMLHRNGVTGVFVNGTTGEGAALTFDERQALAEKWVDSAPRGLRVIIHVGYTEQDISRNLAVHAAKIGADAIGEIGPTKISLDCVQTLVEYTATTSEAASQLPYYYYHMPSINGLSFPMIEYLLRADKVIPNLSGIKYTHDDIADYRRCMEYKDGKYNILFGRDEYLIEGLKAGASGAVGSTYNIMAPLYLELINAFHAGDNQTAQRLQKISAETCRFLYETGGFGAGLKTIMRMIGLDLGNMRHPQNDLSQNSIKRLEAYIEESGLMEFLNKI